MNPKFSKGDRVRVIGEPDKVGAIIADPVFTHGDHWYRIHTSSGTVFRYPEGALEIHGEQVIDPPTLFEAGRFGRRESLLRILTLAKLDSPLSDVLYSFMASRTDLYPYQFKPVLKFVESSNHTRPEEIQPDPKPELAPPTPEEKRPRWC